MKQATFPQIVIVSTKTGMNDNTNELKQALLQYKYGAIKGMSKGVKETGFIVVAPNNDDVQHLLSFAQDSVLVSRTDRTSYLLNNTGIKTELGVLVPVNKEIAVKSDNYTYVESLDQYYITVVGK